jgi:hypothetical protein
MDIASILTRLWNLRTAVLVAVAVSVVGALMLTYKVSLLPPSIKQPKVQISAAQTQILLDSPNSTIGDLDSPVAPLADRAEIYTQFLETEEVRAGIAKVTGLPASSFVVQGQRGGQLAVPGQEEEANNLAVESTGRRVFFRSEKGSPIISVYVQAPETKVAIGLANGAAEAISSYVTRLQNRQRIPSVRRLRIEQLGEAQGGPVTGGVDKVQVLMTAIGLFLASCILILIGSNVITDLRRARAERRQLDPDWAPPAGSHES